MPSDKSGCYLMIFVIGVVVSAGWSVGQWVVRKMTGDRTEELRPLVEAQVNVTLMEGLVKNVKAHGMMKRVMWDGAKWVYAGENEATGIFAVGGHGEARVENVRDVSLAQEGGDFYRREFMSVFDGDKGLTVVTRQGGLKEGPKDKLEMNAGKGRPARLKDCEVSTGWRFTVFGRWAGGGEEGVKFSEMLDGKHEGVTAVFESKQMGIPTILVRVAGTEKVEKYWLDVNSGYGIRRWEERVVEAGKERVVESAEVSQWWWQDLGETRVYYPEVIDVEWDGADGKATGKMKVEVKELGMNVEVGKDVFLVK